MKTKILKSLFIVAMMMNFSVGAQTIAVAPIKTYGLFAGTKIATTLAWLEVVKLDKYAVLDGYDIEEIANAEKYDSCYGKTCLVEYGKELGVDFILSGNIDGLGNKIVVNLKIIDVKQEIVTKSKSVEFDNQEAELQRMIGIVLQEMHDMIPDPLLVKNLAFKNEVITSTNVGRVKNSGPRMGLAYTVGDMNEFLVRSEDQGGLDMLPIVSNLGYQFEGQYVGTENFSALFECLVMFTGLEQGKFIPSVSLLNGFRFGNSGWEFAFGPSFTLSKTSSGFFDKGGFYGETDKYWSEEDFFDVNDGLMAEHGYEFTENLDARGDLGFSTRWIVGFGRTFKSGALNVPVNLFYSSQKGGGMLGLSVGFNVVRAKKNIN